MVALLVMLGGHLALGQSGLKKQADTTGRRVLQFSGLVLSLDSAITLPGVHLRVLGTRRGTVSNFLGFFSMPVLTGDSIMFTSISFKNHVFVVPDTAKESVAYVVALHPDTIFLETVEIMPLPSEEVFKEMFLALQLPDQQMYNNMNKNLAEKNIKRMALDMPMDGAMNHQYYMNRQAANINSQATVPTLSLLNPFAWAQFINAIKRGDFKKKKWQED